MTVDFPYFCGNYTETATKALQEHTGKFNSNGSTRLQGETVTSQGGTRDLATNRTSATARELGPTELYSDSLVIRKIIVQQGLICACTLIVVYKVLYAYK